MGKYYRDSLKYVGPQGKWYNKLVPRRPLGIDLNKPAYNHDIAYSNKVSKRVADLSFLHESMTLVESKDWKYLPNGVMRHLGRLTVLIYYTFVRDFGKNFY